MKRKIFLIGLVILHITLALWYASATPYRQSGVVFGQPSLDIGAPDERQHANYIQRLLDGQGFPVFNPDPAAPNQYENYQAHQPPLYYILAAGYAKVMGLSDVAQPSAGLKIRSLNAFIGAITVVGAFFLGWWGFRRIELAAAAAVFAGFIPMMLALSGAVSNDPLLYCFCTWAVAFMARGVREGWTMKVAIAVGVLCGLAVLTKTTGIALFPVALVAIFASPRRPKVAQVVAAIGIAILLAAPWWLRNQSLYGDPLAMGVFEKAFVGTAQTKDMVAQFEQAGLGAGAYWRDYFGWWTARSFVGAFGYMDIWLNESGRAVTANPPDKEPIYRLVLAVLGLLAFAWLLSFRDPEWRKSLRVQIVTGALFVIVCLLFLRFNLQYFQAQARYLYPAIGPIAVGLGIGLVYASRVHWRTGVLGILALFLGLNLYALGRLPEEFNKRKAQPFTSQNEGQLRNGLPAVNA